MYSTMYEQTNETNEENNETNNTLTETCLYQRMIHDLHQYLNEEKEEKQIYDSDDEPPAPPKLQRTYNIREDEIHYAKQLMDNDDKPFALIRTYNNRNTFVYYATHKIDKMQYDFIISFIIHSGIIYETEILQIILITNHHKSATGGTNPNFR